MQVNTISPIQIYVFLRFYFFMNIYLFFRPTRRTNANNPIMESAIPNPGAAADSGGFTVVAAGAAVLTGVSTGFEVVTADVAVFAGVSVGVAVVTAGVDVKVEVAAGVYVTVVALAVTFDFGGAPMAFRAARGSLEWFDCFSNITP